MKRVTEPVRKSLLDVVKKNLRATDKMSYITRIVCIGKYNGSHSSLEKRVEPIIRNLQTEYPNALISGLLLIYPEYYVHVLEASEGILYKSLKTLHKGNDDDCEIGRSIFLPTYHHVHQRFFTEWFHVVLTPPSLLDIPTSYDLDNIKMQMTNCLKKVYRLCDNIANTVCDQSIPMKEVVSNLSDKVSRILPESTVIEYLLNAQAPVLLTVEDYLKIHSTVPFINLYQDTIWPPPHDFMFDDGCAKDAIRRDVSAVFKQ